MFSKRTFALIINVLLLRGAALSANPVDSVPGSFFFYDMKLDNMKDDPNDMSGRGQAEIVDYQGKHELFQWGSEKYPGRCLRFTPEKPGDYITFRIHIAEANPSFQYKVQTVRAYFNNEGIYQLEVNGNAVGEVEDCYQHTKWTHGTWPVKSNDYEITYRFMGKSAQSPGVVLNLVRFEFNLDSVVPKQKQ